MPSVPRPESRESLFRPAALAHHRRAEAAKPPEPLRIPGRRLTWAYRGLGGFLAAGIAALLLLRVDARVRGSFVARPLPAADHRLDARSGGGPGERRSWRVTAVFPWRYRAAVSPGRHLRLADDGCLDGVATISRIDGAAGEDGHGAADVAGPSVTVHGDIDGPSCGGRERSGIAEATVDTMPLMFLFFPRLRTALPGLGEIR